MTLKSFSLGCLTLGLIAGLVAGSVFVAKDIKQTKAANNNTGVNQPDKPDTPVNPDNPDVPEEPKMYWNGTADKSWYDRNNKQEEYTLMTPEQLAGLSELVGAKESFEGVTIKVGADMCFNENLYNPQEEQIFTPIGQNGGYAFNGNFDGQGYTLKNMSIRAENAAKVLQNAGLFGSVSAGCKISNFNMENVYVVGSNVGAVVAYPSNVEIENVSVQNAHLEGTAFVGGFVGGNTYINSLSIKGCSFTGSMTSTSNTGYIGGVVGMAQYCNLTILDCETNFKALSNSSVSGLVGFLGGNSFTIENNKVVANVEYFDDYSTYHQARFVGPFGGFIGFNSLNAASTIKNSSLNATITASRLVLDNIIEGSYYYSTMQDLSLLTFDGQPAVYSMIDKYQGENRPAFSKWTGIYYTTPYDVVTKPTGNYNTDIIVIEKDRVMFTKGLIENIDSAEGPTLKIYKSSPSAYGIVNYGILSAVKHSEQYSKLTIQGPYWQMPNVELLVNNFLCEHDGVEYNRVADSFVENNQVEFV